jgi:hypothetical protein
MNWNPFASLAPQQPQQQSQQPQQQPAPQPQTPGMANPANPDPFQTSPSLDPQQPVNTSTPAQTNGVDAFKDLWAPNPNAETADLYSAPIWDEQVNVKSAAMQKAIGEMNFFDSSVAGNQELVQNALKGDMNAFAQVLNMVARNAFSESMGMTARMTDTSARIAMERMRATAPTQVRTTTAEAALLKVMPELSHPAYSNYATNVIKQIAQKNPNYSAEQISQAAQNFFGGLRGNAPQPSIDPRNSGQNSQPFTGNQDFSNFFN